MTDLYAAEWERTTPIPLLPKPRVSVQEYPTDALPALMRDAALDISEFIQAPVALAAHCIIGAATHLMQTRANAPSLSNDSGMPSSLYLLSLANSGDRKSSCRALAFRCIDEHELDLYRKHSRKTREIEGKARLLKGTDRDNFLADNPLPIDPRTQRSDATYEAVSGEFIRGKSAIVWDTDEGSQLLAGHSLRAQHSRATVGSLCKAFDVGFFERQRSKSNADISGTAINRRLTIHLLAQPETVAAVLSDQALVAQGFLPRFLLVAPNSLAGSRLLTEQDMAVSIDSLHGLNAFWKRCKSLLNSPDFCDPESGEVRPDTLRMTAAAKKIWLDFFNTTEKEQREDGRFETIRPFASRAGELASRLATVIAGFIGRNQIDSDEMLAACSIVHHSLEEWLKYLHRQEADPILLRAQKLLDWLRTKGWGNFHRDRLGKSGPREARYAKQRDRLLDILVAHNQLLTIDGKHFLLNPMAETAELAESCNALAPELANELRSIAEVTA